MRNCIEPQSGSRYHQKEKNGIGPPCKEHETEKIELAETCIEVYDSVEDFYKATGWQRDNPEEANLEYLLKHRVLVEIQGKMWYFSRIRYQDGLKKLMKQDCT